jgi:enamine deaminase RidA (YjgF/YER057c/UK114 family)
MSNFVEQRLADAGYTLPEALAPIAAYVPTVLAGNLLHISGQVSFRDGAVVTGRLGDGMEVEAGQDAARLCGLMILAQIKKALGGFERVERIVKLGVFVTSTPDFNRQPEVANGASELMQLAFGEEIGRHARSAVGVPALPRGAAVEIDAVVQVRA